MAQFSGAVKIVDLNDFIAPSQACVVSLQGQKHAASTAATPPQVAPAVTEGLQLNARPSKRQQQQQHSSSADANNANGNGAASSNSSSNHQQQQQPTSGFQQTVLSGENQAVKVSLNDCLACSGCVTSAETVLLQAQSLKEFVAKCEDPDVTVVVSISPQSRASLAALHGISASEVQARVANFLQHHLSVALVVDISLGQALALTESTAEFLRRLQRSRHPPAASSSDGSSDGSSTPAPLPMLASACPGWVCYAEKTHGSYILPHIATTRSPQAIMGSLIKQVLAPAKAWDPSRIYHVTVMPCYDKKLEASRDDFMVPGTSIAEVDSSLTTGELQELLDKYGQGDLSKLPAGRSDRFLSLLLTATQQQQQQQQQQQRNEVRVAEPSMQAQPGSSGGYADFIFAAAAAQLYGINVAGPAGPAQSEIERHGGDTNSNSSFSSSGTRLPWKVLRNADMQELQLTGPDGRPLLRFARAYGFRNIQTIVRQIKTGRCPYDYVEVMACPSGCLNGGGQLKAPKGVTAGQQLEQLERAYFWQQAGLEQCQPQAQQPQQQSAAEPGTVQLLVATQLISPAAAAHAQQALDWATAPTAAIPSCISPAALSAVYEVVFGDQSGTRLQQLLHTQYHKREKTVTSTLSDW